MPDSTCSVDGCDAPSRCRGWCRRHYERWRKYGDPLTLKTRPNDKGRTVIERLMAIVNVKPSGCWEWAGAKNSRGYGRITIDKRVRYAHRVAYEQLVGPIPDGLQIDHLCRNTCCVNPAHLEPVTPLENVRRSEGHASKTHCPQGHPYAGVNLRVHKGRRSCRTCATERARAWREAHRAA